MRRRFLSATVFIAVAVSCVGTGSATAAPSLELQSRFAALRHAPTSKVPDAAADFVAWAARSANVKVDASQTRRLAGPDGGWWDVTPGDDGVCFYYESEHVGTCAGTAAALAGRLNLQLVEPDGKSLTAPTGGPRVQIGLLPDDAVSTTATSESGRVSSKPNADGLYLLSSAGPMSTVTMHRTGKPALRLDTPKKMKTWSGVRARAAQACTFSTCYYDGVPPGHFWTPYTFSYNVLAVGNWSTLREIDIVNADATTNSICALAQNPDGSGAGSWFCILGGGGPTNSAYHDYGGSRRRGIGTTMSASATGMVRQFYNSLG